MTPQNPSVSTNALQQQNSFYKTLRGNVSMGAAATYASDSSIATYTQDNLDGILIRVAPNSNPLGLANYWAGSNVDTTITHDLIRVPIGYMVVGKSITCDVYTGSVAWTTTQITLRITDDTADTVLYIF